MDVLSDVLRAVRLTGAVYFDVQARTPWVAGGPETSKIGNSVMPDAQHVIAFHVLLEGSCWVQLDDGSEPPAAMSKGHIVLFPHGDAHLMYSEPGLAWEPDLTIYRRPSDHPLPYELDGGGDGELTRGVCGYLGCDAHPHNPVLEALPRIVLLPKLQRGQNFTVELIRVALEESKANRAGGEAVLSKLSELMFVQALRRYIEELPSGSTGWLAGLRDPQIGAALNLLHGRPAEDWTLDRLASQSGLSRSSFADRFACFVGEPPMRYLARWRMQLALRSLESPGTTVAQVAADVGYRSQAAFTRAFKRHLGVPPGRWRSGRRPATHG